ncbi:hypothetical protein B0H14DRAFT_3515076 [Mycena olivaceomarginata]|nr:hypothetical protein B0H14DRAFT_3515076 [Mycena olivaceomarginata]
MAGDNNDNHRCDDTTGDTTGDNDDGDPHDSPDTPPRKHRIVDVTVDDSDWEDEGTLPGLSTTTHCRRNPQLPGNPRRKQRHRIVAGPNVRATAARRHKEGMKRLDALAADLDAWEVEREEHVHKLAKKHGMKPKEVRRRMLALSTYGVRRKPSTYNAKISRIMADLNKCQTDGRGQPSMLEGVSKEEEKEMIKAILTKREGKRRGTRANNLAAAADTRRTMDRLMTEIASLAEHVGMIAFAMFSRGHVHDKSLPVTIQSWGALDFFLEVLKRDPADVSSLFELWAVTRERGKSNKNRLLTMQQEGTALITMGLRKEKILGVTKCAMTYEGYINKLVRGKGVGLVNWPEGVDFKHMSLQSVIGPLEKLLDSLKCGTTRWKVLTAGEKQQLIAQYEEMVEQGEVKVKLGKTRKAKSRKAAKGPIVEDDNEEEGDDNDNEPPARKTATKRKTVTKRKWSTRNEEAGEDDNDEAPARTRAAKPKRRSKMSVRNDDNGPPAPKAAAKPKRPAEPSARDDESGEDDNDEPPARKTSQRPSTAPSSPLSMAAEDSGEDDEDERPAQKTVAKRKRPSLPSVYDDESGEESDNELPPPKAVTKQARTAANSSAQVKATAKSKGPRRWDANDRALGMRKDGMENNTGGGSKKKGTPDKEDGEPVDSASQERLRPKPLYGRKTTAPAPTSSDKDASHDMLGPPPLVSTSAGTTPSVTGSASNTVRGKNGAGPRGIRVS